MAGWYLLVAAYVVIWAFVFGYVIWMGRQQAELRREVEALRKVLEGSHGPRSQG